MVTDRDSASRLLTELAILADRDVQRRYIEQIVARAGVDLTPAAALMLMRIDEDGAIDVHAVARRYRVQADRLQAGVAELQNRGLIDGTRVTSEGCALVDRIGAARRERIAELVGDWPDDQQRGVTEVLQRLANDLVPQANRAA
jgi:DNA-binding MarR family transcriptional regulator